MPVFVRPLRRFFGRRIVPPPSTSGIVSAAFSIAGVAAASLAGITIKPSVLASAGAATETGVASSTATTSHGAAGVGSASFNGAGIRVGVLSSQGVGSANFAGKAYYSATLGVAGTSITSFNYPARQITTTNILQKPVDCVLAGQQQEFNGRRVSRAAARHAFNE